MTRRDALQAVVDEFERAEELYPAFHSNHEGYAVIREELEELWEAVKRSKSTRAEGDVKKEAVQLAAMALRFVVDLA